MRRIERVLVLCALALGAIALLRPTAGPALALAAPGDDYPVATVAISDIVDEMMAGDRFSPQRVEFENDTREELLGDMPRRMRELEQIAESMDPSDEAFSAAREEFFRLQGALTRANQEVRRRIEAYIAQQLIECYRLVVSSARAVADDLGFDYVIASNSQDRDLDEQSVRDLIVDILGRPVIVYPEEVDITEDVKDDLKL